ncbi:MAG: DUF5107 domain-containing protein [Cellulosilyticaceae bacterium]
MKPLLVFEEKEMRISNLGKESSVPDLLGGLILQNNLNFYLEENDEIFESYGTRKNSFPYRQYNTYNRKIQSKKMKTAVLENDYLKAVFLPELGGRLWSLWDKKENRNLLYTNDVIRYSNLAIRNAWFSGGVEWNMGVIGHSPLTTEPLFTASLEDEEGNPVLRMYEYERIRGTSYQMDFWLGEEDAFLNCRMRIVNSSKEVVPMYWWSNMAVPEYKKGRIIVPATNAYTYDSGDVYKVAIPYINETDISRYENNPKQVDYFFDIKEEDPKYIANIDEDGYGLLHFSTSRLKSRKLFSWGNNIASKRWQEFLTQDAGQYVEIQAGIGKTQYGCIPMPPHTAWEWLEQYGAIRVPMHDGKTTFEDLSKHVTHYVKEELHCENLEQRLDQSRTVAKTPAKLLSEGSGYGALKNKCRDYEKDRKLSDHLDFGKCKEKQQAWYEFLKTGKMHEPNVDTQPDDFMCDEVFYRLLKESITEGNRDNWYAHYHFGIGCFEHEDYENAEKAWLTSLEIKENAWAYHALASLNVYKKEYQKVRAQIARGIELRMNDLSYIKEGFKLLLLSEGYREILAIYRELSSEIAGESRILFDYINALYQTGEIKKAYELLGKENYLVLEDIREGEDSIGQLWLSMHEALFGTKEAIPYEFQFNSIFL